MAKKIEVPKEHQYIIIDLYVNKQYGIQKVRQKLKQLDINYGEMVIKRILTENNIHLRNYNEAKVGRYKMEVDKQLQNKIVDLYNEGYGLQKIVQILNTSFSFDKVKSILKDNGIHIRNLQESANCKIMPDLRKYKINDNYNFQSHNGAWILGLFASDGYLPVTKGAKNRMVLTLKREDEECLQLIKKELQYNGPINRYQSTTGFPNSSLAFTSEKIRKEFESFNIVNAKTFKLEHLPSLLEEKYWLDYLRGYFDGDGCVYSKRNSLATNFTCANENFLKEIYLYLKGKLQLKGGSISKDHNAFSLKYGKNDSLLLCSAFYDNDFLALPRKKEKFNALRE